MKQDNDANTKITKIVKNIVINSLNERLTTTTKVESLNENTLKLTSSLDKEEINTMKTFINKKLNNLFAVLNVIINKNVVDNKYNYKVDDIYQQMLHRVNTLFCAVTNDLRILCIRSLLSIYLYVFCCFFNLSRIPSSCM